MFLLLSVELCKAQLPGFPLIDHTSTWYFQYTGAFFDFTNCNQNFAYTITDFTYSIEGDTIINGNTYLKLFLERYDSSYCSNNTAIYWTSTSSGFQDYIREDQNKLLIYNEDINEDIVKHDYNTIEIGDTLSFNCIIGSIDTLFLLQQPYLRYNCDCNSEFLIQGIGTKRSLLSNLDCGIGIEGDTKNLCYSKNGFTIKIDTISNCVATGDASIYVSTNEPLLASEYSIYPNPTSGEFIVKLDDNSILKNYSVYTFEGREVLRSKVVNAREVVIDLSDAANGVYFLVMEVGNKRIIRDKIIVLKE